MKSMNVWLASVVFAVASLCAPVASADSVPEVLHYRFDGTGTSVPNLASAPPAGAETATLMGALTQTGGDLNFLGTGHSLLGTGNSSSSDYLDTQWATNLSGSWTISFATQDITPSSTLFYMFGDINAGGLRCFTNGVAGPNNWILRGPFTDVVVPGGATVDRHRTTFVYDAGNAVIRAYLDGVLVSTVAQGPIVLLGTGPFKVGGYSANVGLPADGRLDDFRVYNRALTEAEILALDTDPAIRLSGNAQTIANGDTTPDPADNTDFGGVLPGGSNQLAFAIENYGNAPLDVGSITLSGAAAADFTVVDAPTGPIAAGDSVEFGIVFEPSAPGARDATVTVASNSAVDDVYAFAIRGTGLAAAIGVSGNGQPIANGDTTPDVADNTDFGGVLPGSSNQRAFVIENVGDAPLDVGSITLAGAAAADFTVVDAPTGPIAAGDSVEFGIVFEPSASGARDATVTLTSNSAVDDVYVFAIRGTGLAAAIGVSGNGQPIANGDTTPEVADNTDFGTRPLDGTAVTQSFLIDNGGDAPLSIASVSIDGAAGGDFAVVVDPSGTSVLPGEDTVLDIAFVPLAVGERAATVTITSDAPVDGVYTFAIVGTGEAADVQVSKTNFQPHLQAGIETVYTIQVLNAGPAAVSQVRIVDTLPANLVDGAWQCASVPDGLCPNASGGPDIDEIAGPLPGGAVLEYSLIATPVGVPSDFVSNTATVDNLDGSDPDPQNDSATDTDPIVPEGIFLDGFESSGKRLLVPRIGG